MAAIRILVGSVYGGALMTARALKPALEEAGHQVTVLENPSLTDITDNDDALLVCTSTTGQGEQPSNMRQLWKFLLRKSLPPNSLTSVAAAVFGLGDSG